jgi:hypothetical protein
LQLLLVDVVDLLRQLAQHLHFFVVLLLLWRDLGRRRLIVDYVLDDILDARHVARLLLLVPLDLFLQPLDFCKTIC